MWRNSFAGVRCIKCVHMFFFYILRYVIYILLCDVMKFHELRNWFSLFELFNIILFTCFFFLWKYWEKIFNVLLIESLFWVIWFIIYFYEICFFFHLKWKIWLFHNILFTYTKIFQEFLIPRKNLSRNYHLTQRYQISPFHILISTLN